MKINKSTYEIGLTATTRAVEMRDGLVLHDEFVDTLSRDTGGRYYKDYYWGSRMRAEETFCGQENFFLHKDTQYPITDIAYISYRTRLLRTHKVEIAQTSHWFVGETTTYKLLEE